MAEADRLRYEASGAFLELNDNGRRIPVSQNPCMAGTNMKSELEEKIFELIEARSQGQPATMEFEMAYQARIAIDRIRFAIKHTEQFAPSTDQMRDVGLQLLDALQRLEAVDRRFQVRSRFVSRTETGRANSSRQRPDGDQLRVDETNGCVRTR